MPTDMPSLRNPFAALLFLVVTVLGSWWVIKHGMSLRQQKNLAEATAVFVPPLAQPMAQSVLPWPWAFEALPQQMRWRRVLAQHTAATASSSSLLCFWAEFSAEDYALLKLRWGLGESEKQLGLFVDGFLPAWFLEALCEEGLLCPGKERAAVLRPAEVVHRPLGRPLFYAVPRLHGLLGCAEEA